MIKITNLELENIKRIKAIQLTPSESGLTVIGGNNGQGKTSVLDGIAWALGGDKFKPSQPQRDGSVIPPHLRVTLSNGLIVERKGDRGTLKITDPNGGKGGQQLLNEFIGQLALDLPKFMQATSKEKAQTLLRIIGVGDKLAALEQQEQNAYNQRRAVGQVADQKQKYAATLAEFGKRLEQEGLQVIATRVSTGGECSIIIEDGYAKPTEQPAITSAPQKATWERGKF